jgi:site-specific DNA recombinase
MKKVIRYLRFSNIGQSNSSIEAQELCTDQWIISNNNELIDTFIDIGKSAKTFDRPDFIRLQKFVSKYYKTVDYLLVDQLDRFSRNAGEAINMIKDLQIRYNIQVVSATEGIMFDYGIPGSFFRTGLQFLLAEEENINRSIKIRKGIYTAKAHEGRFLARTPPFGYRKIGIGKSRHLVIEYPESEIIKFIYESYLHDVPLYVIKKRVYEMGFDRKGNVAVEKVLRNPIYAGQLKVDPYREFPGGLFPAVHEAIIDKQTWTTVQGKLNRPKQVRNVLDEHLPLRGILKCHCGLPLTGAPSRGKSGKYFYYYKCKISKHNNISAVKAHQQLLSALALISLPEFLINQVIKVCKIRVNKEVKSNRLKIIRHRDQIQHLEKKLSAVEEKWIVDEINKDGYEKWVLEYSNRIADQKKSIEKLKRMVDKAIDILEHKCDLLIDMKHVYSEATLLQKRRLIKILFSDNLYYHEEVYKTPTLIDLLISDTYLMEIGGYLSYRRPIDAQSLMSEGLTNRT